MTPGKITADELRDAKDDMHPDAQTGSSMPEGFIRRENEFGEPWTPVVGEALTGEIVAFKLGVHVRTQKGTSDIVVVRDANGKTWSVFVSAGLNGLISQNDVGRRIWILRVKDTPPTARGRSPMKTYEVGVR